MSMINLEIEEALKALRDKYPDETVEMWVRLNPGEPALFIAKVNEPGALSGACYSTESLDAHRAVEDLIARAGDRSVKARRQARMEALRKELAELGAVACGDNEESHPTEGIGHHVPTV